MFALTSSQTVDEKFVIKRMSLNLGSVSISGCRSQGETLQTHLPLQVVLQGLMAVRPGCALKVLHRVLRPPPLHSV